MASTTIAFLATAVLLLQAPWCAVALVHHPPPTTHVHHPPPTTHVPVPGGGEPRIHSMPAEMALTSFEPGPEETGPTACDGKYHDNTALLAAVSTQWFEGGKLCHKRIRIMSEKNEKAVEAEVVDSCDDHIIATSKAVWEALDLDTIVGKTPIFWVEV